MVWQTSLSLAWVMGMMISPEALFLQGKIASLNGLLFVVPLVAAVWLHRMAVVTSAAEDEINDLIRILGKFGASLILLVARPATAICLAAATLVTSGFVFNETFLYWFPNFAFAALLLIFIVAVNLASPKAAAAVQLLSAATAVSGLLILIILGFLRWDAAVISPAGQSLPHSGQGILISILPFIGYELLRYSPQGANQSGLAKPMATGLVLAGTVFLFWNLVTLHFVSTARLAETTIPHLLTARAVAGQPGRIIIGIVGIAGSSAAINLLFTAVSGMATEMAQKGLLPPLWARPARRPVLPLASLATLTGFLLAIGFAGSACLDLAIRAGLLLWIMAYAVIQLTHGMVSHRQNPLSSKNGRTGPKTVGHLLLSGVMASIAILLIPFHPNPKALLITVAAIVAIAVAATGIGRIGAKP